VLQGGRPHHTSVWNSPTIQEEGDIGDVTARTAGLTLRPSSGQTANTSRSELGKHSLLGSGDSDDVMPNYPPQTGASAAEGEELFFSDSSSGDLSKMI
jgi:hypothetical protein